MCHSFDRPLSRAMSSGTNNSKDKAHGGSDKSLGTYLVQAFLNFSQYAAAKQASLTRRASMSSFTNLANSMSGLCAPPLHSGGATAPAAAIAVQQQPQVSALQTPDHPLILRLTDGCNAESATIQALQQHYLSKWVERVREVIGQMGDQHGIRPSEALAAEIATIGRMSAGGSAVKSIGKGQGAEVQGGRPRRLSSVEQKKERTHDDIIRTVLQHEEKHFFESVLPSRFVEDYQPFIALSDGTLPQSSSNGAVTTSKPHSQQLVDINENPKVWAIPSGSIVKQHPKATFPYSITIFYKPTKTSRTMNDIMCRSSSFVLGTSMALANGNAQPYAGTSDANVTQLVSDRSMILSNNADPLKSAAQYLVSQSAPKSMLGDDAARKRGFTILPFLPYLRGGSNDTHVDPQIAQFLRRLSEQQVPSSAQGGSKESGSSSGAVSPLEMDSERDKEIDFTVDELMAQAGLTLYDVARHGSGPLAHLGRDHVVEQVPLMARTDIERKRQENVIRAERAAIAREETAMRLAETRELSMREEHTANEAIARVQRDKTELDIVRAEAARERSKEERRLSLEQRITAYKAAAQRELDESQDRQREFLRQLEVTLDQRATRRRLDTTLEGERTKAEELSRRAGPISLRLNEFRPKVKQLDQQQRQDNMYTSLVQSLDTSLTTATNQYHSVTSAALADRHQYERKVREELVVRTADADTLSKKGEVRNFHIKDLKRQEELVSRPEGEVSILQIAAKPSTAYYCATAAEEAAREEEKNRNFLEWKERRRVEVEAKMIRSELGVREPRSLLSPSPSA